MNAPGHVLIVGAAAAGFATAQALRRRGHTGALTLLGAEPHPPYDRPPLSKHVLAGRWAPERAALGGPDALTGLGAAFLPGDPAVALDAEARAVRTASGRVLRADAVVVATGLRPRTLPGPPAPAGVHVLRTLGDALALRADLSARSRLVVVGDGVLGAEIAATARDLGADVTLAGPQAAPMADRFGPWVAGLLAALHTAHGVRLRPGSAVRGLTDDGERVTGVRLDSGETLPADTVAVAIGAAPATEWLAGSGLRTDDGLVCDARCRAAEGVYAAGDVARWYHEALGTHVRLENRTNATEQALAVAGTILGDARPYRPVPFFWTDQFDARVQLYGMPSAGAEPTVVDGDPAGHRFVAVYRDGGTVTGVLGWNSPRQARLHRRDLADAYAARTRAA